MQMIYPVLLPISLILSLFAKYIMNEYIRLNILFKLGKSFRDNTALIIMIDNDRKSTI